MEYDDSFTLAPPFNRNELTSRVLDFLKNEGGGYVLNYFLCCVLNKDDYVVVQGDNDNKKRLDAGIGNLVELHILEVKDGGERHDANNTA